mmetsp:Transcript_7117/g.23395  ORF Transcript_7117/g.23395 Transcript_7117/m.23395 type:complete len:384 (+) Transcript_7117:3576-4727(+)
MTASGARPRQKRWKLSPQQMQRSSSYLPSPPEPHLPHALGRHRSTSHAAEAPPDTSSGSQAPHASRGATAISWELPARPAPSAAAVLAWPKALPSAGPRLVHGAPPVWPIAAPAGSGNKVYTRALGAPRLSLVAGMEAASTSPSGSPGVAPRALAAVGSAAARAQAGLRRRRPYVPASPSCSSSSSIPATACSASPTQDPPPSVAPPRARGAAGMSTSACRAKGEASPLHSTGGPPKKAEWPPAACRGHSVSIAAQLPAACSSIVADTAAVASRVLPLKPAVPSPGSAAASTPSTESRLESKAARSTLWPRLCSAVAATRNGLSAFVLKTSALRHRSAKSSISWDGWAYSPRRSLARIVPKSTGSGMTVRYSGMSSSSTAVPK